MKTRSLLLVWLLPLGFVMNLRAGPRSSANYNVATDSTDAGGQRATSTNYTNSGSAVGEFGAGQNALGTSANYLAKDGFVGQLYEIVALSITAPPSTNLNETTSRQLVAAPLADDSTTTAPLDPATVSWSIVNGPIASISSTGLATAGNVYQDSPATVGGAAQSLSGQFNLTILNVNTDDFGAYAGDGIDDAWQVQYFGQPPNANAGPNADADGTGQNNLFKFTAGLNPLDGSRFTVSILRVSGQPSQKQLVFKPLVAGRTYTPQFTPTLIISTSWATLTGTTQSDNGNERTVTDLSASAPKFYRIQITKP